MDMSNTSLQETFMNGSSSDGLSNCTLFSHCRADELSHSTITCEYLWAIFPPLAKYNPYVATIQAVFFAIAFFWNLFILVFFVTKRQLLKEPACILLFNLALTDLMLAVFVILQCLITEAAGSFIIGSTDIPRCWICEILGFLLMFFMSSTLHTLAALSFDRFFLLAKPFLYREFFTWKIAIIIVTLIWILSFILAVPPFFGFGEYSFSTAIANCHPLWSGTSYTGQDNFNFIVFLAVEALIPITFLTFTNIWTCKIVRKVLKTTLKRQRSFTDPSDTFRTKVRDEDYSRKQMQLMKVFGALFVAHICCWVPVLTVVFIGLIIGVAKIPPEVFLVGWILYLTNPVLHPILETCFIQALRKNLGHVRGTVKKSLVRMGSSGNNLIQKSLNQHSSSRNNGTKTGPTRSSSNKEILVDSCLTPTSPFTPTDRRLFNLEPSSTIRSSCADGGQTMTQQSLGGGNSPAVACCIDVNNQDSNLWGEDGDDSSSVSRQEVTITSVAIATLAQGEEDGASSAGHEDSGCHCGAGGSFVDSETCNCDDDDADDNLSRSLRNESRSPLLNDDSHRKGSNVLPMSNQEPL